MTKPVTAVWYIDISIEKNEERGKRMTQGRIRNEAYRTTLICVDSYEQGILTGRFYSGQEEEGVAFHGLLQLLVRMEQRLDQMNYPQSFTSVRSFAPIPEPKWDGCADHARRTGTRGTFAVKVLFRQHTSWQGSVTWLEGQSEQTFRSVLELIMLLDSALGGCEDS